VAQDFRCSEGSCWWGLCIYTLVQVVESEERMEGLDPERFLCLFGPDLELVRAEVAREGELEIARPSIHWPYAGARLTMGVAKKVSMTRC